MFMALNMFIGFAVLCFSAVCLQVGVARLPGLAWHAEILCHVIEMFFADKGNNKILKKSI